MKHYLKISLFEIFKKKKIITLFLICCTGLFHAQNLLSGLQACYPFDANANNYASTGSTLNGSGNNVIMATGHTNRANTAYRLSGDIGSYIRFPNDARIKSNAIAFSGWFFIDSLPPEQYLVYAKNNCSYNFEAYSLITYLDPALNHQCFRVSKSNDSCIYAPQVQSTTIPVIGVWYHIVFYVDNSNIKLYVNGVLEASTTHNILFDYDATKDVFLGVTNESSFNLPFKGRIDNVRFYNRELTLQEINLLHTQESSCTGDVSVQEIKASINNLNVYPNPGQGKIYVDNSNGCSFVVMDILGKTMYYTQKQVNEKTVEINMDQNSQGFYFLQIFDADGNYLQTSRIVITK